MRNQLQVLKIHNNCKPQFAFNAQAASGAASAERDSGSKGTHDSIAASAAAGVKAATEGK